MSAKLADCHMRSYVASEEKGRHLDQVTDNCRQKMEEELSKAKHVLHLHNQKLAKIKEKIDQVLKHHQDSKLTKKAQQEVMALEQKQKELEQQKEEFITAQKEFERRLTSLLEEDGHQSEFQEVCRQIAVECRHLEKALPVYAYRQDMLNLIRQNSVIILQAETGSGKSTQVVQYLLEAGLADEGTIVCTQPRKVAAVSLATRVAQEMDINVRLAVGYKAGTRVKMSSSTKVVYMTDYALLNEYRNDPDFTAFSCVVVDEAHERSLFTDLLLSMLKRCIQKQSKIRVIITSATIDPQVFVDYFGGCPIVQVRETVFPVDVIWQDSAGEENNIKNYENAAVMKAVDIHKNEAPGDILVFLTSAAEIIRCCDLFEQKMKGHTDFQCFPLHEQLQADEQQKVFEPLENKRKIVFATNCAETSITIDGISFVVDTGVAREMRYDPSSNMQFLENTVVSQSSAKQRMLHAGRMAQGKCYRLYSEHSFKSMATVSLPEILTIHLGHALLKLAELGVTPDLYDFVQSPSQESIDASLKTLHQLGAMEDCKITSVGRWIARLPLDPKLGLLTLKGHEGGLLFDTVVLAVLVSAGSCLFYRGMTEKECTNLKKDKLNLCQLGGDSITALHVYKAWQAVDEEDKNKWCASNSINAKVIRGVRDTVNEICEVLKTYANLEIVCQFSEASSSDDKLRNMLFQCYASHLCGYLASQNSYFALFSSRQVHIHRSSAVSLLGECPQWLVYDQLLHTSRFFVRGVTPVEDQWVREFSWEHYGFDVDSVLQKALECAVRELRNEVSEEPIGSHQSSIRVLLGRGAAVTDILMPQETSKVFIHKPSHDITEGLVRQKFQTFGSIGNIRQIPRRPYWGFVVFETAAQAKSAADATRKDENNVAVLEYSRTRQNNAFKAQLSWNRRPSKGFGWVTLSSDYLQRCIGLRSIQIGGVVCRIIKQVRDNITFVKVTNLVKDVTEDQIKRCLLRALHQNKDTEGIVELVTVSREDVGPTSQQDLDRFQNDIRRKFEAHLKSSTVEVTVHAPPSEKTAMFTAEARFSDPNEGQAACKALSGNFCLNNTKVTVKPPVISATLRVSRAVHDACRADLEELRTRLTVEIKPTKMNYLIVIKANDIKGLVQAKIDLNKVIQGDVLECSKDLAVSHLLTASGRKILRVAESDTATHIAVDNRLRTVSNYGTAAARKRACERIDEYLLQLRTGTVAEMVLRGPSKPPGLLKALCALYGGDLDLLRQQAGLHGILVDYVRHTIKLIGPEENVQKGQKDVEAAERDLAGRGGNQGRTDGENGMNCSACLCPISTEHLYRLHDCAHPFCLDCMVLQVEIAIKDHHFPIRCCHDGCDVPLVWKDFRTLSDNGRIKLPELASASLSAFVLANRDKACFCSTPDCPAAYRVTSEDSAEAISCPECEARTCSACHEPAHDGLTCAMLRSSRSVRGTLDDWIRQDPRTRKKCPGCGSPIEKTGGCNKMHCSACDAVFCWVCLETFHTNKDCEDHLVKVHKGIFAEPD